MSELEFERAGRGPYRALANEFAWGNSSTQTAPTSIVNGGTATEAPGNAANCHWGNAGRVVDGPLRVGALAYGDATRIASGAGDYGSMELSGNLYERTVTVSNTTGRAFEGRYHGNGVLTNVSGNYGHANVSTWPGTNATGSGLRGGSWGNNSTCTRLSDRFFTTSAATARGNEYGGRSVRLAP